MSKQIRCEIQEHDGLIVLTKDGISLDAIVGALQLCPEDGRVILSLVESTQA